MIVFVKHAIKWFISLIVTILLFFAVLELLGLVSVSECFDAIKNLIKNFASWS